MTEEIIIIGVDPGTVITGYGIIKKVGNNFETIDYGCIRPPKEKELNDRFFIIHEGIENLLKKHIPSTLIVETQYVNKNIQSSIKLAMARAAIILAAKRNGIEVVEYTPTTVKKAVTGTGSASKHQIQGMIQKLLCLKELPQPEDAADALALAICYAQKIRKMVFKK